MNKPQNIRAISAQVVHDVAYKQRSLNQLLPAAMERVEAKDKALLQEIIYGTCRWFFFLESVNKRFLVKAIKRDDKLAETLLKVGAYQLHYTRIPLHAAINETVAAADVLGLKHLKGLINAVLRKVSAEEKTDESKAALESHPKWMQEKIRHNWPYHWQSIFDQNNQRPPMTLRVNLSLESRKHYLEALNAGQINAKSGRLAKSAISLESPQNVTALPGFSKGRVSVQDEAGQLCSELLDIQPGMRVLDACAAPGGKTCAMLEFIPDLDVLALDADASRADLISANLARLNLSANILITQAENVNEWWNQKQFERILLDAPCSASGVIRRHPDIKLLRRQEDIKKLAELQLNLLSSLWPTLKASGKLLYATCSIFPQENSRIIERFLKQEPSARLLPLDVSWGINTGFGHQLLPQLNGHDGFFYACLSKQELSMSNP